MMMMHHHRPKLGGHSGGIPKMQMDLRAHHSIDEVKGFPWSPHLPSSAGYSSQTAPVAAEGSFLCIKKRGWSSSSKSLCTRLTAVPLQHKLHRHLKDLCCRAGATGRYLGPNTRAPPKACMKLIEKWS